MIIALLIGIPLGWYATQQYMQRFTDQVHVSWWHYLIPVSIAFVIMMLSISSLLWKAASENPVESLRHE